MPKKIHLNAFESFTIGHSNPGQWANPKDRTVEKHKLEFWQENAKLLEKGKFTCYFLADTLGGFEVYGGSRDPAIKIGTEFPVLDPFLPIVGMAQVTKSLGFGVTATTTFEQPLLLARRFSTLDHFSNGRIAWNIVTSWNNTAAKALGKREIVAHDERYLIADEYLELLYKFWQGSIADGAVEANRATTTYIDPKNVKTIKHEGKYFYAETPFLVDPSPQRTPFLFQAGTSAAGSAFAAKHAEAIFVASHSPEIIAPKIKKLRELFEQNGRDPYSVKIFPLITTIIGKTEAEAQERFEEVKKYRSLEGGLIFFSALTGIDLSKYDLDEEISASEAGQQVVLSAVENFFSHLNKPGFKWTPRKVGEELSIGGNGPVVVGSAQQVADVIEHWIEVADVDGFNISPVVNPGSYEEIVDLLVPELQKRGLYWQDYEKPGGTLREQVYGAGQAHLRDDHFGNTFNYSK